MLSPSPSSAWHHQSLLPGGNEDDLPGRKGNQAIHLEDEYPFIGDRHESARLSPVTKWRTCRTIGPRSGFWSGSTFIVESMRGHANSTDHAAVIAQPPAVDLVPEDDLALTPDAATVLARIVRARVRSESSTMSCHTDAAHSMP